MIICRFILNLRQVGPAGSSLISENQSASLRFIGNIGQSLQIGDEDEGEGGREEERKEAGHSVDAQPVHTGPGPSLEMATVADVA